MYPATASEQMYADVCREGGFLQPDIFAERSESFLYVLYTMYHHVLPA